MDYIINYLPFITFVGFGLLFMIDYIAYCATSAIYRASGFGNAIVNSNNLFGIWVNLSNFTSFGLIFSNWL